MTEQVDFQNKPKDQGNAWENSKKTASNHPDYTGKIELPKTLMKELVDQIKQGHDEVELRIAIWNRKDKKGNPLMYLSVDTPLKRAEKEVPAPRKAIPDSEVPF